MKFTYPAVLLKDPDSIYGLVFPDLACYPSNETLEGLMTDAQEALALHIEVTGKNTHHMIEACFKSGGRSLRQAIRVEGTALPSTKGVL